MTTDQNDTYEAILSILKDEKTSPELTAALLLGCDEKRRRQIHIAAVGLSTRTKHRRLFL